MQESILVVDSAPAFLQFASLVLTRLGNSVAKALDGESALKFFDGSAPQLVLSEAHLPGMSGPDLCTRVRSCSETPFVFLTTDGSPRMREEAQRAGCSGFLTKPVTTRTLHDLTERFLPNRYRRQHMRAPMVLAAAVRQGDMETAMRTTNLGEGGLFLETDSPRETGTKLALSLPLPGLSLPIHVSAEVVYITHGAPSGPGGMGVKFVGLDENAQIFLRHYLESYLAGQPPGDAVSC